jgi:tetratricopeptide (TPR) repeat protein
LQITVEYKVSSLRRQIRELLINEDWQNAIILGDYLISLTPEDPAVYYHMGLAWLHLYDVDQSEKFLQKAQELGDDSAELLLLLGNICAYRGDLNGEFFWAKKALEREPDNLNAQFVIANSYRSLGQIEESEAAFKEILERNPDNVQARSDLADIFLSTQRLEESEEQLHEAIKLQPDDGSLYAGLGHVLTRMKREDDALVAFLTALDLEPDIPVRYYNVGDTYLALENIEKAVLYLRKASQMAPDNALYHYDLGLAYFALKRYDECVRESKGALQNDPEMRFGRTNLGMSATQNLGIAYMNLEKYEDAKACFQRNLALIPSTYFNLGLTLFRQQKFEEALVYFKRAVELVPDDPEYWDLIGSSYIRLNRFDEAKEVLQKAIQVDDTYALAHHDMGIVIAQQPGHEEEAMKSYNRALDLDKNNPYTYYDLCCLYVKQNKKKTAFEYLNMAIQKGFSDSELINTDHDLDPIRDDDAFKTIIKKMKKS